MEILNGAVLQSEVDIQNGKRVQQLSLVLVQTLDLDVIHRILDRRGAVMLEHEHTQLMLLLMLDLHELVQNSLVVCILLQLLELGQVGDPLVRTQQTGQQSGQLAVVHRDPASRGDAVGLVLEALRPDLVEAVQGDLLQNVRMDRGNAVDIAGTVHRQISHVDLVVFDDLNALDEVRRTIHVIQLINEHVVDALDDVVDIRNDRLHDVLAPLLQRLRKDGVVGVSKGLLRDLDCLSELDTLVGGQQAYQLRNRDNRMGIVQLDGVEVSKAAEIIAVNLLILADDILQGCRAEEVLLLQTQLLALVGGIVRIQNAGDVLSAVLLTDGCVVVLLVELVEVERLDRLCLPQTQVADVLGLVADDRNVVRNRTDGLIAELNQNRIRLGTDAPRIAEAGPVVRGLLLEAVLNVLLEQAVAVADAVAVERKILRCRRVQEAGCQTAQTAVAQRSVLNLFQHAQAQAVLLEHCLNLIINAETYQIVVNCTSDQEFSGHIVCMTGSVMESQALLPIVRNACHQCLRQCMVQILRICLVEILSPVTLEVKADAVHQIIQIQLFRHSNKFHLSVLVYVCVINRCVCAGPQQIRSQMGK